MSHSCEEHVLKFMFLINTLFYERARIAQSVLWQAMGWVTGVRFSAGARDLSLLHSVQTGSGAHPISYPTATLGILPSSKEATT
jgi:hypothetical protein